jgi:hypothetical protein
LHDSLAWLRNLEFVPTLFDPEPDPWIYLDTKLGCLDPFHSGIQSSEMRTTPGLVTARRVLLHSGHRNGKICHQKNPNLRSNNFITSVLAIAYECG